LEAVMLKISDGVSKVAMLTIPFFVLAGAIMAEGGMARRLVAFADVLVGLTRLRGGLSIVSVLATTFLSGISGSAVVIILGGILGGVFTATEAGAVACIWAFFVTMFVYRDYRWRDLPLLLHRTLRTVAMVLTLIACASSVGYVMALTQMPAKMTAFFLSISSNKYVILLLINILLLVLGTLIDMAPSILIATPILLPVMQNFGVNPVHFGTIMLLNLGIGLCHPPVGSILFVGCAVGKVTIEQVMRKIWPFYAVMFVVLMLVTYVPAISLSLPQHVLR
jgi:tripartite ATP-independent transporter DctM subunit